MSRFQVIMVLLFYYSAVLSIVHGLNPEALKHFYVWTGCALVALVMAKIDTADWRKL